MSTPEYPIRHIVRNAVDIYRDAVREFIVRQLRRVSGRTIEQCIEASLPARRRDQFARNLGNGTSPGECIDVGDFPHLVNRYWPDAFSEWFRDDRTVISPMYAVTDARNDVSHPPGSDTGAEAARVWLYHIQDVLVRINRPDLADSVGGLKSAIPDPNVENLADQVAWLELQLAASQRDSDALLVQVEGMAADYAALNERFSSLVEALAEQVEVLQQYDLAPASDGGLLGLDEETPGPDDFWDDLGECTEELQRAGSKRFDSRVPVGLFPGARFYCLEESCFFYDGSPTGYYHEHKAIEHHFKTGHEFAELP